MPEEQQAGGETPEGQGETPAIENFDEWMAGQPEPVQNLLDRHTQGLKSALQQERDNAKTLAKQVRELSGKLDKNTEAGAQLAELSAKLETEQQRADFYEEATAAGCRDLRLAWLAAHADGLTVRQVQQTYPDLFAPTRPPTHAGNGAQQGAGAARDMNLYIRRAAGRG